jgi:D-glycero-alpha-D-manno-heptose-7-phosphate kinase
MNRIDFSDNKYTVTPINISPQRKKELSESMLLYFTGKFRKSKDIQNKVEKEILKKHDTVTNIKKIAQEAQGILENKSNNFDLIGKMLGESWEMKRSISSAISCGYIDELYNDAVSAGALGGKLLGAGEGGFLLLYTGKENRENVKNRLVRLKNVPFEFSENGFEIFKQAPDTSMSGEMI